MVSPGGNRKTAGAATRREALQLIRAFKRRLPGRTTIDEALLKYEQCQRAKGNKVNTIDHNLWRLRVWLDDEQPIADITPKQIQAKYDERVAKLAVDSHRGELAVVKTFFNWAVKEGLVSKSPAARVDPVGRRRRGKKQLRKSEAQAFAARALLMAQAGGRDAGAYLFPAPTASLGCRTPTWLRKAVTWDHYTQKGTAERARARGLRLVEG